MLRKVVLGVTVSVISIMAIVDIVSSTANAANSTVNMSATINPSSTVEISANSVALNVVPSAAGTFKASTPLTVNAYTNSNYNCTITMETSSTSLTSGANSIATLDNTYTESTFVNDKWGFSTDATNYGPVALTNSVGTFSSTTPNAASITFAAKLTQATKPGTYSGTVNFATTCTPPPPPAINDLTYMQDFATLSSTDKASVLDSMTTGQQYQLRDNRDQKDYYISKLADGNVWMTQNLDHDIVAQANYYTPENTDISSAWIPSEATYTTDDTNWSYSSDTVPESYDPGDLCWDGTVNVNRDGTLASETNICGNDKHYHIGNYYNWTAAVAMNDSSSYTVQNTDVDQSICPAGWRLPIGGTTNTGSKSFSYLWNYYDNSFDGENSMNPPLYFSYAGYLPGSVVGSFGVYWSSVVNSSRYAYDFASETDMGVSPQGFSYRSFGNSIRCVAR